MKLIICILMTVSFAFQSWANAPLATNISNELGFEFMQKSLFIDALGNNLKNKMISPLSLEMALAMALNGTSGPTRKQALQRLALNSEQLTSFNQGQKDLLDKLYTPLNREESRPETQPQPVGLLIANSAWYTPKAPSGLPYEFLPSYVDTLNQYFNVNEVIATDFTQQSSVDKINGWSSAKTEGLIPSIVDLGLLKKLVWVLLNAVYFEGGWETPFSTNETLQLDFHNNNNTVSSVQKIWSSAHFKYLEKAGGQVIELPFYASDIVFIAVLTPKNEDFITSSKFWSLNKWQNMVSQLEASEKIYGTVQLPKFSFDSSTLMNHNAKLTQAMNLNFLFGTATLGNMDTNKPLHARTSVGVIKQDTRIELDESGVKAAAVTLVGGIERTSVNRPKRQFQFIADRPFSFAIYDKASQNFLFLGTVVNL